MAHFVIEMDADRRVASILRDGVATDESVRLEQLFGVVTIYFKIAAQNLRLLGAEAPKEKQRGYGLTSFLTSLTGLEAFANTYFHVRSLELDKPEILERIGERRSLAAKFRELLSVTGDPPMKDQEALLERVHEYAQLRNEMMHPKWAPASVYVGGSAPIAYEGLVESRHALFEDVEFCREAALRCLLVVARIAEARGSADVSGFLFHWTGHFGLTLDAILSELGELPSP